MVRRSRHRSVLMSDIVFVLLGVAAFAALALYAARLARI